jgi:AcrR family transcriptional regulator
MFAGGGILHPVARPALTRAIVVEHTRALIRADGARATSLRSVARELGVTAPALYAYVSDYADLLAAVAETEFRTLAALFASVRSDDPIEHLREMALAYVAHARAEPHLHRLMFRYTARVPSSPVTETFAPATEAFTAALAPVDRAIAAGRLRVTDPVLVAFTAFSAAHGVAEFLLMGLQFPEAVAQRLIDTVIDATLRGLTVDPPDGHG